MSAQIIVIDQNAQFFSEFNTMVTVTAACCIAVDLHVTGHINYQPGDYVSLEGHLLKRYVRLPLVGPVGAALSNRLPDYFHITVEDSTPAAAPLAHNFQSETLRSMLTAIFHPMVVNYFERHRPQLEAKFSSDRTAWPAAWQMGWLVRNGLSHGNKVHFERASARPVTWQGVSLGPMDSGRQLVFGILNQADLLLLLFEMEDTLFTPLARRAA
jgi:hypothetical protein